MSTGRSLPAFIGTAGSSSVRQTAAQTSFGRRRRRRAPPRRAAAQLAEHGGGGPVPGVRRARAPPPSAPRTRCASCRDLAVAKTASQGSLGRCGSMPRRWTSSTCQPARGQRARERLLAPERTNRGARRRCRGSTTPRRRPPSSVRCSGPPGRVTSASRPSTAGRSRARRAGATRWPTRRRTGAAAQRSVRSSRQRVDGRRRTRRPQQPDEAGGDVGAADAHPAAPARGVAAAAAADLQHARTRADASTKRHVDRDDVVGKLGWCRRR